MYFACNFISFIFHIYVYIGGEKNDICKEQLTQILDVSWHEHLVFVTVHSCRLSCVGVSWRISVQNSSYSFLRERHYIN